MLLTCQVRFRFRYEGCLLCLLGQPSEWEHPKGSTNSIHSSCSVMQCRAVISKMRTRDCEKDATFKQSQSCMHRISMDMGSEVDGRNKIGDSRVFQEHWTELCHSYMFLQQTLATSSNWPWSSSYISFAASTNSTNLVNHSACTSPRTFFKNFTVLPLGNIPKSMRGTTWAKLWCSWSNFLCHSVIL